MTRPYQESRPLGGDKRDVNAMKNTLLVCCLCALAAAPAAAAADKFLGKFNAWEASRTALKDEAVCFAASQPTKRDGKLPAVSGKRVEPAFLVAHWSKRKAYGQIQVKAGFALEKDSKAELTVGDKKFEMFVRGDSAWARDAKTDAAILAAMREKDAKSVRIAMVAAAGKIKFSDTYSLLGLSKAMDTIDKACGRKPAEKKPGA